METLTEVASLSALFSMAALNVGALALCITLAWKMCRNSSSLVVQIESESEETSESEVDETNEQPENGANAQNNSETGSGGESSTETGSNGGVSGSTAVEVNASSNLFHRKSASPDQGQSALSQEANIDRLIESVLGTMTRAAAEGNLPNTVSFAVEQAEKALSDLLSRIDTAK